MYKKKFDTYKPFVYLFLVSLLWLNAPKDLVASGRAGSGVTVAGKKAVEKQKALFIEKFNRISSATSAEYYRVIDEFLSVIPQEKSYLPIIAQVKYIKAFLRATERLEEGLAIFDEIKPHLQRDQIHYFEGLKLQRDFKCREAAEAYQRALDWTGEFKQLVKIPAYITYAKLRLAAMYCFQGKFAKAKILFRSISGSHLPAIAVYGDNYSAHLAAIELAETGDTVFEDKLLAMVKAKGDGTARQHLSVHYLNLSLKADQAHFLEISRKRNHLTESYLPFVDPTSPDFSKFIIELLNSYRLAGENDKMSAIYQKYENILNVAGLKDPVILYELAYSNVSINPSLYEKLMKKSAKLGLVNAQLELSYYLVRQRRIAEARKVLVSVQEPKIATQLAFIDLAELLKSTGSNLNNVMPLEVLERIESSVKIAARQGNLGAMQVSAIAQFKKHLINEHGNHLHLAIKYMKAILAEKSGQTLENIDFLNFLLERSQEFKTDLSYYQGEPFRQIIDKTLLGGTSIDVSAPSIDANASLYGRNLKKDYRSLNAADSEISSQASRVFYGENVDGRAQNEKSEKNENEEKKERPLSTASSFKTIEERIAVNSKEYETFCQFFESLTGDVRLNASLPRKDDVVKLFAALNAETNWAKGRHQKMTLPAEYREVAELDAPVTAANTQEGQLIFPEVMYVLSSIELRDYQVQTIRDVFLTRGLYPAHLQDLLVQKKLISL